MTAVVRPAVGCPAPAELFAHLSERRGAFFLDSAWPSMDDGAYSFIGFEPFLHVRAIEGVCTIDENGVSAVKTGDPIGVLRSLLRRYGSTPHATIPFTGGAVGYFSYEWGATGEKIAPRSTALCPDFEFNFYDGILAFEHATGQWVAVANPVGSTPVEEIFRRLETASISSARPDRQGCSRTSTGSISPCEDRADYLHAVQRIKDYIQSGDVYQVNLSQRFEGDWPGDAFALYKSLRASTPAPFGACLQTSFGHLLSCSPERFLHLEGDLLETRPIKGTRPRGADKNENDRQIAELSGSAKERAELLMIVDLERNDLGKVCVPG
jgi:para-aminobenzoate synthetase component 1